MRQCAGELAEGSEAFEPVQFGLALMGPAQLRDHLVETACQQADLVSAAQLRHRFQSMGRDVLSSVGDSMDWFYVALCQHISKDQSERKYTEPEHDQPELIILEWLFEIAEIGQYLNVAKQVILHFDRDEIDRALRPGHPEFGCRHCDGLIMRAAP